MDVVIAHKPNPQDRPLEKIANVPLWSPYRPRNTLHYENVGRETETQIWSAPHAGAE